MLVINYDLFFSHVDEGDGKLIGGGYACPQCRSKYCELPVECRICGLMLVSAPHLARSYHHLFPVQPFTELPMEQAASASCYTCLRTFKLPYDKNVITFTTFSMVLYSAFNIRS